MASFYSYRCEMGKTVIAVITTPQTKQKSFDKKNLLLSLFSICPQKGTGGIIHSIAWQLFLAIGIESI